jgi:D-alanyl-D-alanine dipeptidase
VTQNSCRHFPIPQQKDNTLITLNPRRTPIALLAITCWTGLLQCSVSVAAAQLPAEQPLRSSTQMIAVTTTDWNSFAGQLERYERARPGKRWKAVGSPVAIVVGKNGLGWGAGLIPTDSPSTRSPQDPVKKEGDGKSPAGVFRLKTAFGYAAQPQPGWKMPYIKLTPSVECVDDSASRFYNRVLDRATVAPDWYSSEQMSQAGEAYRWGVVVDHNANPIVPGLGSCVFLHIWGGPGVGTAGCTAMPQEQLEPILAWLDPARNPLLVQLPLAQYKKLRRHWHLPRLPKT